MYKHILRDPGHHLHELAISGHGFEKLGIYPAIRNSQTRHLARNHEEYDSEKISDEDCYGMAIDMLNKCAFFGLLEEYNRSVHLLFDLFGWKEIDNIPHLNQSRGNANMEISQEDLVVLRELNNFDGKLYSYAEKQLMNFSLSV